MKIYVDTAIFIDILKDEYPQIQEKYYHAFEAGASLITSAITAAILMPQFRGNRKELLNFLGDHRVTVMDLDLEPALVAADRWIKYLTKRTIKHCPSCNAPVPGRDHILADFLIGGFALTHCDRLLTRDRGIYKTYFSDLMTV
jgi:predicted nucleic acid-binding protein